VYSVSVRAVSLLADGQTATDWRRRTAPLVAVIAATVLACGPLPRDSRAAGDQPPDDTSRRGDGGDDRTAAPVPVAAALVGRWKLWRVAGVPVAPPGEPTLEVSDRFEASGSTGVNRYSTAVDRDAADTGRFRLSPIAATKRGASPEAMARERRFLDHLAAADRFTVEGEILRLWSGDREALAFTREGSVVR
jgi:heat shock protein HslJ